MTLFKLLDLVEGAFSRVQGKTYTPAMDQVVQDAFTQWDLKCGRDDVPRRVPDRVLEVEPADEGLVKALGAEKVNGQWVVPEGKDLNEFEEYWPQIAEDLRDKQERGLRTKNGQVIEAHREAQDLILGNDSIATPLMYAALPVVAALAYLAASFFGANAGMATMALALPFLIAIMQHEDGGDATMAAVFWLIAPYVFATKAGALAAAGPAGIFALAASMAMPAAIAFAVLAVLMVVTKPKGLRIEALVKLVKWTLFVLALLAVTAALLPASMLPIAGFVLAAVAGPMSHTEKNFLSRANVLEQQGFAFNLGRTGPLALAHLEPRQQQAVNAHNDKTPVFTLGWAKGWLTQKQYPYAPDANLPLNLSALDLTMHLIVFGNTGIGKTESVMRPLAKQWCDADAGGFVALCGKGSLPGDLSGLIELMITSGVDYAPMQGLDATNMTVALNAIETGKEDIWDAVAKDYVDHITVLHEALRDHELAYKNYARIKARHFEDYATRCLVQLNLAQKLGDVAKVAEQEAALERAKANAEAWRIKRDTPRQWLWNLRTLVRLSAITNEFRMVGGVEVYGNAMEDVLHLLGHDTTVLGKPRDQIMERRRDHGPTIHPDLGQGSLLDGTISFFLDTWKAYDGRQRQSFMINFNKRLQILTRGKYLVNARGVHWSLLEKGEDVSVALYGGKVGFDLPETMHGPASAAISIFAMQRFYADIQRRASNRNWREEGQKQVMFMIDEAHLVIGEKEKNLASIARSLGLTFVCATQHFESLKDRLAKFSNDAENAATLLLNQFQSAICLQASARTYEYLEGRLGTTTLVRFPRPTLGIDYNSAVDTFAHSPLNDPNSFYASAMQRLKVLGAGRPEVQVVHGRLRSVRDDKGNELEAGFSGHRTTRISEHKMASTFVVQTGGRLEKAPLVEETEWEALLTGRGTALIFLNRAGYRRVDFATLPRVSADECRKA